MTRVFRFGVSAMLYITTLFACALASVAWFDFIAVFFALGSMFFASLICFFASPKPIPRSWAVISYVLFMLLLVYVASYGPATWALAKFNTFDTRRPTFESVYNQIYTPVTGAIITSPWPIRSIGTAYLAWWLPADVQFHDWGDGLGYTSRSKLVPNRGITQTLLYL
jgi:hypothetical protein